MNEIEVINLVLNQIGEIRVPMRDEELRGQLTVIRTNLEALRDAFVLNREKAQQTEEGGAEE